MKTEKIKCPVCKKLISPYSGFLKHFAYMIKKEKKNKEDFHDKYLKR